MKRLHVSSHAEGVIAAEVAEVAAEFKAARVVNVSHVPLHVRLVHALVRAKRAAELRAPRVHLAAELHVPLQQVLQRVNLPAVGAHVSLVHRVIRQGFRNAGHLVFTGLLTNVQTTVGDVVVHVIPQVPRP